MDRSPTENCIQSQIEKCLSGNKSHETVSQTKCTCIITQNVVIYFDLEQKLDEVKAACECKQENTRSKCDKNICIRQNREDHIPVFEGTRVSTWKSKQLNRSAIVQDQTVQAKTANILSLFSIID
jgi:hypothetical protein